MKTPMSTQKHLKTKALNVSTVVKDPADVTDLENRIQKLESIVMKMSTQNELLVKRLDDFEAIHSKSLSPSFSVKSFSTSPGSNNDYDMEDFLTRSGNKSRHDIKEDMTSSSLEFSEWKKDIEKCIEKLSDKVAQHTSTGPNLLVGLLETRVNDLSNEITRVRKICDESFSNVEMIKKYSEKSEKAEKLLTELLSHLSFMKSSNQKWQMDFQADISELRERMNIQEKKLDQQDILNSKTSKTIEVISKEIQNIPTCIFKKKEENEEKIKCNIKTLDDKLNNLIIDQQKIENKIRDEGIKSEVNIKALWDSFALLTSTLEN